MRFSYRKRLKPRSVALRTRHYFNCFVFRTCCAYNIKHEYVQQYTRRHGFRAFLQPLSAAVQL